nr:WecB/TagA/CpsF family glycosyltransferase [Paracoccus sp. (in: a-proteobacteria)]
MLFRFDDGTRIEVNCASAEALLKAIADRLRRGEGFAGATINIDHLDQIGRDAAFRRAYAAQDLVVADGNPVVWLSRIAGRPVSLAPGSDLVVPIARVAAKAAAPVALIGSTPQALAAAADALRAAAPGLDIVLCVSPGFPFDPEGEEADAIL